MNEEQKFNTKIHHLDLRTPEGKLFLNAFQGLQCSLNQFAMASNNNVDAVSTLLMNFIIKALKQCQFSDEEAKQYLSHAYLGFLEAGNKIGKGVNEDEQLSTDRPSGPQS